MEIRILQLVEGARAARGLTVIIDVFRAMTVEAYLAEMGAVHIYPVGDQEIAYAYKRAHPEAVLVGERGGVMLPGFDFGNSPSQIKRGELKGRTVIHTTSAGTQGLANASGADEILTGCLANADAVARYIRRRQPEVVSLVCMGLGARHPIEEDTLCAEYIRSLLEGKPLDVAAQIPHLQATSGAKFFDPARQEVFPEEDFWLSVETGRFDFVQKLAVGEGGMAESVRIPV